jgi:phage terminase large subunit
MQLDIKHSSIFTKNLKAYEDKNTRFIINQGSSRSTKTYSIIQLLIYIALTNGSTNISIVRESLPLLKRTVIKDFVDIMNELEIYDSNLHNMTEHIYKFKNKSIIKFVSTDEVSKLRGLKQDILFINEANLISLEAFIQLNIRTSKKVFMDFNPSEIDSYIYDILNNEPEKSILIHSTYKDNPFLPKEQIKEIESLIKVDPEYHRVYALGLPPTNNNRIYSHFTIVSSIPEEYKLSSIGIDFGFNDPTALVYIYEYDQKYIFEEKIYQSYLTSPELITLMNDLNISKLVKIYADTARPEIIKEMKQAGYRVENAIKDIKEGINCVKSHQIAILNTSINLINESKKYMWKTINDRITDTPIDMFNHLCDAFRYGLYSNIQKGKITGKIKVY